MNAMQHIMIPQKPKFNYNSMLGAEKWLKRLNKLIENNIADTTFSNERIAEELKISERQLFRKVKKLTGYTPQKYLKHYRLRVALKYFRRGKYRTVKETAHAVGFRKVSHFIKQFENEFGKKPLQVLQEFGWR